MRVAVRQGAPPHGIICVNDVARWGESERTLDTYMDVILGLLGLSRVLVGLGEGVC